MCTKLIADSSCDIFAIDGVDFASVPLTIATDQRSFVDDKSLDVVQMLSYMAGYEGRSYTTCPNVDAWHQAYRGADEIYVVCLSSNISGTYAAAASAAELYKEEHPDAKIHIFDTLSAGPSVRLAAEKIAGYISEGKSFAEICDLGEAYLKSIHIFFCLKSFHNFAQNGRVNKTVAKLGSMLGIRIMATASDQGTITILDKCRGDKGCIKSFLEKLAQSGYAGGKVCLAHCQNPDFAQILAEEIQKNYPGATVAIYETGGLCSYYAEAGGILLGFEKG